MCRVSLWVCWFSHREHFRRARSHLSVCVCVCVLKIVCRRSCSFSRVCAVLWLFVFEVLFACFHLFCVWVSCVSGCVCVCSGCLSVGACACACARVCRRRTRNVTVFFHVICFSRFVLCFVFLIFHFVIFLFRVLRFIFIFCRHFRFSTFFMFFCMCSFFDIFRHFYFSLFSVVSLFC